MRPQDFIDRIAPLAIADMRESRVCASLTIAQGILESNWGESLLTRVGNNLFGIKGLGTGGLFGTYPTQEFIGGKWITVQARFRHYRNWAESIHDHTKLLLKPRYKKVVGAKWEDAIVFVREAGYATDPAYTTKLRNLINRYKLYQYDAMGEVEDVEKASMIVNGVHGEKALVHEGKTYVYTRELEKLGVKVTWNNSTKTVHLSK